MLATQMTQHGFPHAGGVVEAGTDQLLGQGLEPFFWHGPQPVEQASFLGLWLIAGEDLGFDLSDGLGVESDSNDAENGRKTTVFFEEVYACGCDSNTSVHSACFSILCSSFYEGPGSGFTYLHQTVFLEIVQVHRDRAMWVALRQYVFSILGVCLGELIEQVPLQVSIKVLHDFSADEFAAIGGGAHA